MLEYSIGNSKVGRDTLIFNMNSATDCPSRKLGLCNVSPNKCYALKAEKHRKACLPYRRRQEIYWESHSAKEIVIDLLKALQKHKKIKYVRISESGDFRGQKDFDKLKLIATCLGSWTFYTYTARRDLNLYHNIPNLVVNGSGFMADNLFTPHKDQIKARQVDCLGDCTNCTICKTKGYKYIYNPMH